MKTAPRKVVMLELNEITWDLIDPLIEQGKLPTFERLKREGTIATPVSDDLPPQLDPWITWTTLYTGRKQDEHNVYFLQQPPESIRAKRVWEICAEAGLSVGVYGSLCSWPPRPVVGFYVPDTFAQDPATYPPELRPIQELNLTYTRSVRLPTDQDTLWFKARLGAKLVALGLRAETASRIVRQLALERREPGMRWRRVALQPVVNFDFFSRLYRERRPRFATFHSNHVAHYQHTYWKAMRPELYPQETSPEEARTYGGAIEHGYRVADELLGRMLNLIDRDTVLVVASSMGQQPFIADHKTGRAINQVRSPERLLKIIGVDESARALATMSDQFNIYDDSPEKREFIMRALQSAYVDREDQPMFYAYAVDDGITVNLRPYIEATESSRCYFPHLGPDKSFAYEELVYTTGGTKSGRHDPRGMMIMCGAGIRRGGRIQECTNLDIAPTLLTLMGLDIPTEMRGRVLEEAMTEATAHAMAG